MITAVSLPQLHVDPASVWAAIAALAALATVTLSIFLFREARASTKELHHVVDRLSETNQREGDVVSGLSNVVSVLSEVTGRLEQLAQLLRRETAERRLLDRLNRIERVHEGVMLLSARAGHADDHLGQGRYIAAKALLNAHLRSLPADELPDTRAVAGMLSASMVVANIGNAFVETSNALETARRDVQAVQTA